MALMPFDAIFAKSRAALTGWNSLRASSGRNVPYVTPQIRSFSSPENRNLPRTCGRLRLARPEAMAGTGSLSCDLLRMLVRPPSQYSTKFLESTLGCESERYYRTITKTETQDYIEQL